jgi:CDP-diacylglycerol--glycerol-3-phosphate 3-phosphatidyltransferase
MLANYITLARFPLLVIYLAILYRGSPAVQLAGVGLLLVGLMLDTVDGVVARRTGSASLIGGVLDIAADRSYELALWVCFADLGLIPAAIPLVIILRTTLTDALRSIGVAGGAAPLDQARTGLARFLVGSTWMRSGYSVTKIAAFCGLALTRALGSFPPGTISVDLGVALGVLQGIAWLAVAFCLCRGLPVLAAGVPRLRGA